MRTERSPQETLASTRVAWRYRSRALCARAGARWSCHGGLWSRGLAVRRALDPLVRSSNAMVARGRLDRGQHGQSLVQDVHTAGSVSVVRRPRDSVSRGRTHALIAADLLGRRETLASTRVRCGARVACWHAPEPAVWQRAKRGARRIETMAAPLATLACRPDGWPAAVG